MTGFMELTHLTTHIACGPLLSMLMCTPALIMARNVEGEGVREETLRRRGVIVSEKKEKPAKKETQGFKRKWTGWT